MSLRQFRYFVAVAERGSFGRAAADLNIAQSALSRHVGSLEQRIGARLLERSQRGTQLTAVGQILFDDARMLLTQVDSTLEHARRVAMGSTGQLAVAMLKLITLCPSAMGAIANFLARNPRIDLQLPAIPSLDQMAALRAREIDAGFMIGRSAATPEIDYFPVLSDRFVAAMPEHHPLASRDRLSLDDLRGLPFVTVSLGHEWSSQSKVLNFWRTRGFQPRVVLEVKDLYLQLALIARSVGVGLVVESAARAQQRGLAFRPITDVDLTLDVDLVWMRSNSDPLLADFISTVRAESPQSDTAG